MNARSITAAALALALVPASAEASRDSPKDLLRTADEMIATIDELEAGVQGFVDGIAEAQATAELVSAETERLAAELARTEQALGEIADELGQRQDAWVLHQCRRIATTRPGERRYLCLASRDGVTRPAVRVLRGMHTIVRVLD